MQSQAIVLYDNNRPKFSFIAHYYYYYEVRTQSTQTDRQTDRQRE